VRASDSPGAALENKDVLIIAGGYDNALDGADVNGSFGTESSNPNAGNAIYIVDADTGARLFWASHAGYVDGATTVTDGVDGAGNTADIKHANMRYAMSAAVNAIDVDGDGIHDRLYVGDTGGQIWRLDIGQDIVKTGGLLSDTSSVVRTVLGRLASIATPGTATDERRFYSKMDAALVIDTVYSTVAGGKYTYVTATTGYRPHPLNSTVQDRFYAFRDFTPGHLVDNTTAHHADTTGGAGVGYAVINHTTSDMLIDVTSAPVNKLDPTSAVHKSSYGYYFDFPDSGEKGITPTLILGGKVFFSTYSPNTSSVDACSANIGTSYAYAFSLQTGEGEDTPTADNVAGRRISLGAGLASDPLPIFTVDGVKVVAGLQQSLQDLSGNMDNTIQRTYWYEQK